VSSTWCTFCAALSSSCSLLVGGQLPSGNQVEDIAQKFNEELWKHQPGSKKVVKDVDLQESTVEGGEGGTHIEEIEMPEDYVHEYALTFAVLGRPSASPDHDLALAPNSGPKKKKRRSEGPKQEEDGANGGDVDSEESSGSDGPKAALGTLSRRGVTMMVSAGESQSRGDARTFHAKEAAIAAKATAAGAALDCKREMVDLLKSPPQDAQQAKMAAAVENISHLL